jgi:hypothetical protein
VQPNHGSMWYYLLGSRCFLSGICVAGWQSNLSELFHKRPFSEQILIRIVAWRIFSFLRPIFFCERSN